jgi:hypothetical protein
MGSPGKATNVELLLRELCEELGFSLPPRRLAHFEELAPRGIDAFTDAVFVAEGLDPHGDGPLRNQVRARVAKRLKG